MGVTLCFQPIIVPSAKDEIDLAAGRIDQHDLVVDHGVLMRTDGSNPGGGCDRVEHDRRRQRRADRNGDARRGGHRGGLLLRDPVLQLGLVSRELRLRLSVGPLLI